MNDLLVKLAGTKVDILCSNGAVVRGEVGELGGGVLSVTAEDGRAGYVAIDKISAVWEVKDTNAKPGFVG